MMPEKNFALIEPEPPFGLNHKDISTGMPCEIIRRNGNIYRNVVLSAEYRTDITELRINTELSGEAKRKLLYTLGTAISRCYADYLGVESDEIDFGITVKDTIFIYDTCSGGAGYSNKLGNCIDYILEMAYNKLVNHSCKKACTRCLIDKRTILFIDMLDKDLAIEWLEKEKSTRAVIPDLLYPMFAGKELKKITKNIDSELFGVLNRYPERVLFFLGDDFESSALIDSIQHNLDELKLMHKVVLPVISTKDAKANVNLEQRIRIMSLEAQYSEIKTVDKQPDVQLIVSVSDYQDEYVYFKYDGAYYKVTNPDNITIGQYQLPDYSVAQNLNSDLFVNRVTVPNTSTKDMFKTIMSNKLEKLKLFINNVTDKNVSAKYQDRYMVSPGSCIMLGQILGAIEKELGIEIIKTRIQTCDKFSKSNYRYVNEQFLSTTERDEYLTDCIISNTKSLTDNDIAVTSVQDLAHQRILTIFNKEFIIEINPDGGFMTGWKYDYGTLIPFGDKLSSNYNLTNTEIHHYSNIRYTIGWERRN